MSKEGREEVTTIAKGGRKETVVVAISPFRLAQYKILASPSVTRGGGWNRFFLPPQQTRAGRENQI